MTEMPAKADLTRKQDAVMDDYRRLYEEFEFERPSDEELVKLWQETVPADPYRRNKATVRVIRKGRKKRSGPALRSKPERIRTLKRRYWVKRSVGRSEDGRARSCSRRTTRPLTTWTWKITDLRSGSCSGNVVEAGEQEDTSDNAQRPNNVLRARDSDQPAREIQRAIVRVPALLTFHEEVLRWQRTCETTRSPFSPMSKRRRGYPSETRVSGRSSGPRRQGVHSRSSVVTTSVHADLGGAFKKCCLKSGRFDGSPRNYYRRD